MFNNSTKFLITDQDAGMRLDIVLVKLLPSLSRSSLKKIIELKQVKINSLVVKSPSKKLKKNDHIEISLVTKSKIKILLFFLLNSILRPTLANSNNYRLGGQL